MLPANVDDLRLIWVVALNAAVFAAAYLCSRRWTASRSQAACDAFLGLFAVEYISVCLPGVLRVLNPATMSAMAGGCVALLAWGAWGKRFPQEKLAPRKSPQSGRLMESSGRMSVALAAAGPAFVLAYLAYMFCNEVIPTVATDPLVYHLPTAVWWLQHHSLAIYPTWYWNPAASYCPLSGSAFIAWLIAPMGNDVLARFVQFPALLFIFCLVVRFCRLAGCSPAVAAWVAVAAAMARPFFSETMFPKDDLFVAAFVGAAVVSAASENLRDRLGPWRCGITVGMVLASKYTVLLVCPVLLFLIDAPVRARWRPWQWATAIATALLLAGGWYLRNGIRFGDPIFPVDVNFLGHRIFTGLFGTERDVQLQSAGGVRRMIGDAYYSWPWLIRYLLAIGWAAAMIKCARDGSAWRDPLRRTCLIGAPITLGLFVLTSPHHEVRYLSPLLLLFFACAGMTIAEAGNRLGRLAGEPARRGLFFTGMRRRGEQARRLNVNGPGVAAGILAAASIATSFAWSAELRTLPIITLSLAIAVAVGAIVWLRPGPQAMIGGASVATLLLIGVMYVYWDGYVEACEALRIPLSGVYYPRMAGAWSAIAQLPPEATVAYANTYLVYPLYDFRLHRRVVYAPVRRGLHDFEQMPRLGDAVPGDQIVQTMTRAMDADADRKTWYPNLAASGADYLLVAKNGAADGLDADPPEWRWAKADPRHFEKVFEDADTVLYRIHYTSKW